MQADDEALELVARRAGGSMRDAAIAAGSAAGLRRRPAHRRSGAARCSAWPATTAWWRWRKRSSPSDAATALAVLEETAQGGLQMGELVDQMLAYWRDLMVVQCAGDQASDLSVPSRCRPDLIRQGKALTLDAVLAGLDVLSTTRLRLRDSSHGRTLVEMALVRLCRLSDLLPVAQLAQMLASGTRDPAQARRRAKPPHSRARSALRRQRA